MRIVKHSIFYFIFALVLVTATVQAQEAIPSVDFNAAALRAGSTSSRFTVDEKPSFTFDNAYLNDTLRLQYQNILLEKMIVRQGAIARTEKSFIEVGVPFNQPPPPRGICEQIPVNVPCYKAYPDLYPGVLPQVSQIEEGALPEEPLPVTITETPVPIVKEEKAPPAEKAAFNFDAYRWAEITCAGGQCKAVISHNGTRRTASVGDIIGEGVKIDRITAMDVEASKDGKTEKLQAALAPSRGGASSPKYAGYSSSSSFDPAPSIKLSGSTENKAQQLNNFFGENAAPETKEEKAAEIPPEAAAEDIPPDDIADPGPPLGNTGLY